jgi:3-deoxy-D-manno-octulosonate 8-phosphate phosphatase (KDO 8-P phosphatase)
VWLVGPDQRSTKYGVHDVHLFHIVHRVHLVHPLAFAYNPAMALTDIRLLVLDVDGVLTDGRLYYGPSGEEIKAFHSRDGAGIRYLMEAGLDCALLSGRESEALRRRAADLGIARVVGAAGEKGAELGALIGSLGLEPGQVAYVGDDLPDLAAMRLAGWSACPADAVAEVRAAADLVASSPGGLGAVREIVEHLLRAQGRWEAVLARYRGD